MYKKKSMNIPKLRPLPVKDASSVRLRRTRQAPDQDADTSAEITSTEKSTVGISKNAKLDNTYKIDPDEPFSCHEVEETVRRILVQNLKDVAYDPVGCKLLSQQLAAKVMEEIKGLQFKRYKMVAVVSIGSIKERPGMQFGSRCLWNKQTDTFATIKFTNGSLFAVVMVYGLYFE